jgi:hypothetical protein
MRYPSFRAAMVNISLKNKARDPLTIDASVSEPSQNKPAKTLEFSCDGFEQNGSRQGVSMDHGGLNEQKISRKYPLDIWIITKMATTAHLEALTILRFFLVYQSRRQKLG